MSDVSFNLKEIVERSVSYDDFPEVADLLVVQSEGDLSTRLTPSKLRDVADGLLSVLLGGEKDEDR